MVKSRTEQTDLGAYYTPPATVEYLLRVMGQERLREASRIVEPSGGDGIFVRGLLEAGVDPAHISVWDIDPDCQPSIEAFGADFSLGDTLGRDIAQGSFDAVVGNPPYLNKRSAYVRANKDWLGKKFKEVGASETYIMFTFACAAGLRHGGRLGFVLSDTFLTLGTHRRFRDWLLDHTKIIEVSLAPAKLFDVAVSTVLLVVERADGPGEEQIPERDNHIVRYYDRVPDEAHYGDPAYLHEIRQGDLRRLPNHALFAPDPQILALFEQYPSLIAAGLDGHIGMHTRDNAQYLVDALALGEPGYATQQAAVRAGELMPYLKTGGIIDYWSDVREYVKWDAVSRKAYVVPKTHHFGQSGVAISGVSARLSARLLEPGCYWDTNKVMGFRNETGLSDAVMVGLLNSRLYNYLAKAVLNTTASIQIDDLRRLPLIPLSPAQIEQIHRTVGEIITHLRTGKPSDRAQARARASIDEIVYSAGGIDSALRAIIDAHWEASGGAGHSAKSSRRRFRSAKSAKPKIWFELWDEASSNMLGDFESDCEAARYALEYIPDAALAELSLLRVEGEKVSTIIEHGELAEWQAQASS